MQRSSTSDPMMPNPSSSISQPSGGYAVTPFPGYSIPGVLPGQSMAPPPMARQWPTLPELVNALKRRLVLATFLGMLVGAAAGAGVWLAMPAGKHQVRALLEMRPYVPLVGKPQNENDFEDYKKNQLVLVKTRPLLTLVVGDPKVNRTKFVMESDDPIRDLDEKLRTRWEAPSILAVSMNGDEPNELKVILDALVTAYVQQTVADELRRRNIRLMEIDTRLGDLTKQIEQKESLRRPGQLMGGTGSEIGGAAKLTLLAQESQSLGSQIDSLTRAMRNTKLKLEQEKAELENITKLPINQDEVRTMIQESDSYAAKAAVVEKQNERFVDQKKLLQPGSPLLKTYETELQQAQASLKELESQLRPTMEQKWRATKEKSLRLSLDLATASLKTQQNEIETLTEDKKKKDAKITEVAIGEETLQKSKAELLPLLNQREILNREKIELSSQLNGQATVSVKEEAAVTLNQNLKQKVLLSIAGSVVAFGVILLAVAFLEWRSRRVDSVEQVVNELGIRVIGTIPAFPSKASLKSGDAATSQNWRFVLNESVNSARTMLLHAAKTQNMQVLMVTSAMQGEGKTSLASQLATSMATAGLRTLVLDGDLRNPSMHKLFDAPLTPGCAEVLCQEIDVSDAVQPTAVPNLWIIPAGQCSNRVISALAQGHPLETLFNRLRGQFDIIVVDSCPILPVADALLFGQHVDGVVMSILQDISQLPKVQTASEKLTQLNIPLLGAVVNGIKPDIHAYGYNYVKQLPA